MIETKPPNLRDQLIQLTRDLVMIPSSAERPVDVERAVELVRHHVDDLPEVAVALFESDGNPSIAAMPAASPKRCDVLLCAHVDVVAHGQRAIYRPEVDGDRIVGPGAGDMKGQLAILLTLFRAVHRANPGTSLGLVVTTDEEVGGMHGIRYLLDDVGLRCDVAIIPDGGGIDAFPVEEKGILHLRMQLAGTACHAARPWLGQNALLRAARLIDFLQVAFPVHPDDIGDHWYPTCTATVASTANAVVNRVPDAVTCLLDCRFPPPFTSQQMLDRLHAFLGPHDQMDTIIAADPSHLNPDPLYLQIAESVNRAPSRRIREAGGSDGRFFAQHNIPVIISRPAVGNLHDLDEWIDVPSMLTYYQITAGYLNERLKLPAGVADRP